ncbi:MAG: flagellar hook-length control protein FliK [Nitrospira sp.]
MATDMQPVFNGLPSHSSSAIQDVRDRQPAVQGANPSRNFDSVLGRAGARQMPSKHDAPTLRSGERTASHAHQVVRSTPEASSQPSERSTVAPSDDQSLDRCETADHQAQSAGGSEEKSASQESKRREPRQDTLSQDMLLAAMVVPAAQPAPVEQPPQAESENHSETAVNEAASISIDGAPEGTTSAAVLGAASSEASVATQAVPTHQPAPKADAGKEAAQAKDTPGKETLQTEAKELPSLAGDIPGLEARAADRTDSVAGGRTDPDRLNPAIAALTSSRQNPHMTEQGPIDRVDRSAILDALAQGTSMSEGQAGSGTGRFLEPDGQGLSDSSEGTDRSLPNQVPSVEQNARPAFMDRINEVHQSAPAEGSIGRNESGQTAAVLRASASERTGELGGMTPVSQSVTLDLDPLDMGPLRVRVMMSDQTVHAHIRTEHGELGQGLLQQGQSLESSLRTSGLEMGMLRVTVDQQHGRGDNAWMFQQQQQQQSRPPSPSMSQAVARDDERGAGVERRAGLNERVSFFA